jgi:hypothetical protein
VNWEESIEGEKGGRLNRATGFTSSRRRLSTFQTSTSSSPHLPRVSPRD